jgi:hypothetical protein
MNRLEQTRGLFDILMETTYDWTYYIHGYIDRQQSLICFIYRFVNLFVGLDRLTDGLIDRQIDRLHGIAEQSRASYGMHFGGDYSCRIVLALALTLTLTLA